MSKSIYFFTLTVTFAVIAFCIQSKMFLCGDVAFLLHVTDSLLSGGTYARDFFETNPPMILLLYTPAVVIAKFAHADVITTVRIYILSLSVFSISLSLVLLKELFTEKDLMHKTALWAAMIFVLLFLPAGEFGQREHVFLILFLPYVFLAAIKVEKKTVPNTLAIFIGVMAALGIGMKPFFLAPLLLIELYLMISATSVWRVLRAETLACALVLFSYLAGVYFAEPSYVHVILPLVSHLYFLSSRETWAVIFSHLPVIFCLLVVVYGCVYLSKQKSYPALTLILLLALIGMIAAFLIPRSAWYYHLIPAMGFAILFMSQCLSHFKKPRPLFFTVGALILMMPLYASYSASVAMFQAKLASDRAKVIMYVESQPAIRSVYCFSASFTQDCFPLVNLTKTTYGGRSPFFWWVTGLVSLESKPLSPVIDQDKKYLINAIAEDLTHNKTDLVIINVADMKNKLGATFDYVTYFSTNEKFQAAWRPYYFVKAIGDYALYQRKV